MMPPRRVLAHSAGRSSGGTSEFGLTIWDRMTLQYAGSSRRTS
jgi:hypothetical protein